MATSIVNQRRERDVSAGPVAPKGDRFVGTSLLVLAAGLLLLQVMAGDLLPEVAVPAVLYVLLAVALLRRRRRWLLITAIVLPVLHLVGSLPFLSASLTNPESPASFIPDTTTVIAAVTAVVGAAVGLRRGGRDRRGVAMAAVGVGVVAILVSLVAAAGVDSAVLQDGDVVVEAADVGFPDRVEAPVGATLWVDNQDPVHHTILVEGGDIHHDLPGGTAVRVPVDLEPGTYQFLCDVPGHDQMRGELVITAR